MQHVGEEGVISDPRAFAPGLSPLHKLSSEAFISWHQGVHGPSSAFSVY